MKVRFAHPEDSTALLAIYGQYIHTNITFEYDLPNQEEFARRIAAFSDCYPYLAEEEDGVVAGYAYAHRIWERTAYQWDAELSVYLSRAAAGKGLGKRLCRVLLELLRLQGIRTVYALVTVPNEKSEGLHRAMGFRHMGTQRNTGYKDGAWRDVTYFEKPLAGLDDGVPQPPQSVHALPEALVASILEQA